MEENFWDKYLQEKRKKIEEEEKTRSERIERAKKEEESWKLARICKVFIEEVKTNSWYKNKEIRREMEKSDAEKRLRLEIAKGKKRDLEKKFEGKERQEVLHDLMRKLPDREREVIELEERKRRRLRV